MLDLNGLMVHFTDIHTGKFSCVPFYEVARLYRQCDGSVVMCKMVGFP